MACAARISFAIERAPLRARSSGMDFDCPRCRAAVTDEFYGPCESCRIVLRASGGEQRAVAAVDYEPKMNVVPNQVATKD